MAVKLVLEIKGAIFIIKMAISCDQLPTLVNNSYQLNTHREVFCNLTSSSNINDIVLRHRQIGHLNFSDVNKLPERGEGVDPFLEKNKTGITCATCLYWKTDQTVL